MRFDRLAELLLRLFALGGEIRSTNILRFANDHGQTQAASRILLRTEREDIGDLFLALTQPIGVVVEKVPTIVPVHSQLMANHEPTEHDPHQFARVAAPLGRAQHDVTGDVAGIADEPIRQLLKTRIVQVEVKISNATKDH